MGASSALAPLSPRSPISPLPLPHTPQRPATRSCCSARWTPAASRCARRELRERERERENKSAHFLPRVSHRRHSLTNTSQVLTEHFPGTTLVPDIRCLEALPEVRKEEERRGTWLSEKKKKKENSHHPVDGPTSPPLLLFSQGIDLVTAGFPCIDVSRAGLRTGLTGRSTGLVSEGERHNGGKKREHPATKTLSFLARRPVLRAVFVSFFSSPLSILRSATSSACSRPPWTPTGAWSGCCWRM